MRRNIYILFLLLSISGWSRGPVSDDLYVREQSKDFFKGYGGFRVQGGDLIWTKVFELSDRQSIRIIQNSFLSKPNCELKIQNEDVMRFAMVVNNLKAAFLVGFKGVKRGDIPRFSSSVNKPFVCDFIVEFQSGRYVVKVFNMRVIKKDLVYNVGYYAGTSDFGSLGSFGEKDKYVRFVDCVLTKKGYVKDELFIHYLDSFFAREFVIY